jgi:hypothetical protein
MMHQLLYEAIIRVLLKYLGGFLGEPEPVHDGLVSAAEGFHERVGHCEDADYGGPEGLLGEEVEERFFAAGGGYGAAFEGADSQG